MAATLAQLEQQVKELEKKVHRLEEQMMGVVTINQANRMIASRQVKLEDHEERIVRLEVMMTNWTNRP